MMNKWIYSYTDDEMVADLRSIPARVEQMDVEQCSGEEVWLTRMWMVLDETTGVWKDAHIVYRGLLEKGFRKSALSNVNRLDLLNELK